jgi:hypothetical protein
VSVLLRIDNTTAVAYIKNQWATVSSDLVSLTRDLWMWYPGPIHSCDTEPDSRQSVTFDDGLDHVPEIFSDINKLCGPLEVDLFAPDLSASAVIISSGG